MGIELLKEGLVDPWLPRGIVGEPVREMTVPARADVARNDPAARFVARHDRRNYHWIA